MPSKIALYARVSTRDKGQDLDNQLQHLRTFAASQGWTVTAEYVDQESGSSPDRPRFRDLFRDASKRRFDAVLFWSLDRFSREGALSTLQHLNQLTSYGVQFRSFTELYLDSCGMFREAVISILAVIAKQERQRISERTIAGLERARRQGKRIGRPPLTVDRLRVVEMLAAGESLKKIAVEFGISKASVLRIRNVWKPSRDAHHTTSQNAIPPGTGCLPEAAVHGPSGSHQSA